MCGLYVASGQDSNSDSSGFCCFDDFVVQHVQGRTDDRPFYHIFIAIAERLPYRFFIIAFSGYGYSGPPTGDGLSIRSDGLGDMTELYALGRDEVTGIRVVRHCPKWALGVCFGYLEEGLFLGHSSWAVICWKCALVRGCQDT